MEFDLYFTTLLDYVDFVQAVTTVFSQTELPLSRSVDRDGTYFSSSYFSLTLLDDPYSFDMIADEHNFEANKNISIEVFSQHAEEGMSMLFQLITPLLKQLGERALFLGDTSIVIFRKETNTIYTYDYSKEYFFTIPFELFAQDFNIIYKS